MKKGENPTWEERLRLVSRALGGTAGGTRILRRSGGWRGVCKREYTVKRGSAKGNTLQKRGFLKGIHCEKGICKGIHCKREYTVKGNTGLSKRERRVLHFKTMLSRIVVTGQAKSQAKQCCVSQHRYLDAFHERENKLGRCDSYLRNLKLSLTQLTEMLSHLKIRKQCSWDFASVLPAGCSCR